MYFTTASAGFAGALGQLWARRLRCDRSLDEGGVPARAATSSHGSALPSQRHPSLANRGREGPSREICPPCERACGRIYGTGLR